MTLDLALQMSVSEATFDEAVRIMQATSKQLLELSMAKLYSGKALTVFEVEELREALETIATGLDQDSLHCQAAVDSAKEEEELKKRDAPSDYSWPASSLELHPDECLSHKDHIEQFWGFIPNDAGQYQMSFQNVMSQTEIGFEFLVLNLGRALKEKNVSQRGEAFSKEEDWIICSAFLNVSKDPVTGTNQSSGGYYQRMHVYFHENLGTQSNRSVTAIQHRWLSIQKVVNKFSGFFSTVERLNERGHNEQSRINEAVKLYEDFEAWTFGHCWDVLPHEPKWNDKMLEINTVGNATRVNQRLAANSTDDQVVGGRGGGPVMAHYGAPAQKAKRRKQAPGGQGVDLHVSTGSPSVPALAAALVAHSPPRRQSARLRPPVVRRSALAPPCGLVVIDLARLRLGSARRPRGRRS
ncbi:hypothetical protein U9M48_021665 [Paspalum notatum var. saurae]|uniref:No apical meristem-associated C-terminal domain-containing protein n=1 Tax=Paspalum notatum var. saurae TaxID=547442 RepID=A0AAQ3TG36_PASNO